MGKLEFTKFVPKFFSWQKSQPQGVNANASLDVEAHILDSTSIEAMHAIACEKGFAEGEEELLVYMGGYFLYSGLLPFVERGAVVFSPPPLGAGPRVRGGGGTLKS